MKLFWTPASPFTRKVCVVARETRQWHEIEVLPTIWPLEWGYQTVSFTPGLVGANPLARIPALVTDEGETLGDSTIACMFLNERSRGPKVIPNGPAKWRMWSLYAVADGALEAQVAMRAESLRPQEQRSPDFLAKQRDRLERCFDTFEARADELHGDASLANITVAIACGYQLWREWLTDFSPGRPELAAWYQRFSSRPSLRDTEPRETPEA
jgi:glutathione S-transferase